MKLVLGVDGGGTKTICKIASFEDPNNPSSFRVLGTAMAGPSNPRSIGFAKAFQNIESAVREAMTHLSIRSTISSACLALAGAGRAEEQLRVREWFQSTGISTSTYVIDDIEPIRRASCLHHWLLSKNSNSPPNCRNQIAEYFVTLISGTGSIGRVYLPDGTTHRTGGWGYILGDEGSGYRIGLTALQSICQSTNWGEPLSELQQDILSHLRMSNATELIPFVYADSIPRSQIASLAGLVLKWVESDPVANSIAQEVVRAWTDIVRQLVRFFPHPIPPFGLAIGGGIAANHRWLVDKFVSQLKEQGLHPIGLHIVDEPVLGCLQYAMEQAFAEGSD